MIRSMTGYGRGEIEENGIRISAEIKSVNNRFLEVAVKLPRFLAPLESDIRGAVQRRLSRGRLFVDISWDEPGGPAETVVLDEAAADVYYKLLQSLKDRFGLSGEVDLATFASLPELLKKEVKEWEPARALPIVSEALGVALDDLVEMKTKEGEALAHDLRERLNLMLARLDVIEKRAPERVEELRDRLAKRLKELNENGEYDEALLTQEVVIFAERTDYTEECVRFRIHCENFIDYLGGGGAVGRKLNFLLQELGREANTIGAKAGDALVSENVVIIKEELEKVREQVQNIE
ncbi:MAG: YicC/YloC family endoribonuclease [bacterium]